MTDTATDTVLADAAADTKAADATAATDATKTDDPAKDAATMDKPDTTAADTKSDDADGKDGDDADGKGDAPAEFKLEVPEGAEAYTDAFKAFETDMNTWLAANPKATPQEALAEAARRQLQATSATEEDAVKAFNDQVEGWEAEARKDTEIGGDKFEENVAIAVKALDEFGTPELKQVLVTSGLGSHPEIIRFAKNAGAALADAQIHGADGAGGGNSEANLASRYPKSKG